MQIQIIDEELETLIDLTQLPTYLPRIGERICRPKDAPVLGIVTDVSYTFDDTGRCIEIYIVVGPEND